MTLQLSDSEIQKLASLIKKDLEQQDLSQEDNNLIIKAVISTVASVNCLPAILQTLKEIAATQKEKGNLI
jgi:hypothetical protein